MLGSLPALARTAASCCKILNPSNLHRILRSPFGTGPRQEAGTIFELRTYDIEPAKTKEFMELVNRDIHIRMAHSELTGFWTAELGSMNTAFHIWKYDNFAHRAAARKNIVSDKEWQEKLSAILPLLKKQDMEIAYLVPWCELGTPPKEGVYELITYQQKPGGPALWGQSFKAAIDAHVRANYAKLIGVFHTEYGLLNTGKTWIKYDLGYYPESPVGDRSQDYAFFGGMRARTVVQPEGIVPTKIPGW